MSEKWSTRRSNAATVALPGPHGIAPESRAIRKLDRPRGHVCPDYFRLADNPPGTCKKTLIRTFH